MSHKLDLQAIRARCDAAFVGPWVWSDFTVRCGAPECDMGCQRCEGEGTLEVLRIEAPEEYPDGQVIADVPGLEMFSKANGEFIAHARTDVPNLVARVEQLEAALERLAKIGEHNAMPGLTIIARAALGDEREGV